MQIEKEKRKILVEVCREVYEREMVSSSGGNISLRCGDALLITPSGYSLGKMTEEDIVKVSFSGVALSPGKPSKELALHTGAYQARADIEAVVHVHSPFAVCVSCMVAKEPFAIPAMTPGYAIRVGNLPVVPFFVPGSPQLAEQVKQIVAVRDSALLCKHGIVSVGKTLQAAINLAEEIEENAKIYVLGGARADGLTEEEAAAVVTLYA